MQYTKLFMKYFSIPSILSKQKKTVGQETASQAANILTERTETILSFSTAQTLDLIVVLSLP